MKIWKSGDKGAEVVEFKQRLRQQGFWPWDDASPNYTDRLAEAVAYFQQTHINEKGEPCGVDGKVGPETLWALKHPTGKSQKSGIPGDNIPGGLSDGRAGLLQIALAEHGIKEIPNGSNRGLKPRGGVDKYLPGWQKKPGEKGPAWCCYFVFWVGKQHFGHYPMGKRQGSCSKTKKIAVDHGLFRPARGIYTPVPGDAFVMLYKGTNKGKGHIGFVYRVSSDGNEINTVEGNCGNRVKIGKRSLLDSSIAGFIDFWNDGKSLAGTFNRGLVEAADVGGAGTR